MRSYFTHFKFQSVTSQQWKDFLFEHFADQRAALDGIDWAAWFTAPGMPPVANTFDGSLAAVATTLADRWLTAGPAAWANPATAGFGPDDLVALTSNQMQSFLNALLLAPETPLALVEGLDLAYAISAKKNTEVRFRWQRLGIKAGYAPCIAQALAFVTEQGRMKYVRPLYRDLFRAPQLRESAVTTFHAHRHTYHNIAAALIEKDLAATAPAV